VGSHGGMLSVECINADIGAVLHVESRRGGQGGIMWTRVVCNRLKKHGQQTLNVGRVVHKHAVDHKLLLPVPALTSPFFFFLCLPWGRGRFDVCPTRLLKRCDTMMADHICAGEAASECGAWCPGGGGGGGRGGGGGGVQMERFFCLHRSLHCQFSLVH